MSISRDENERAKFRSRQMAHSDMLTSFDNGVAKGRAIGWLEGITEVRNNVARNLKALGTFPLEAIAQATGLTLAQVQAL